MTAEERLSGNLRLFRQKAGLTQKQLGDMVGYTEKAVSKWELGYSMPSYDTLAQIGRKLGADMNTLLGYTAGISALLGIDGGATKTDFVLTDLAGNILAETKLTSCNPIDIGMDAAKKILREGIRTVTRSVTPGTVACFAGISGGTTGNNKTELASFLSDFGFAITSNGSDIENAVACAIGDGDGIVSIIGTGSITFAVVNGAKYRIGGYGYLFDEGGSGYDIGAAAIRAALRQEDGSGENTLLYNLVTEKAEGGAVEKVGAFYAGGKSYIASFSPLVFKAYRAGDKVAENILRSSMSTFANQLKTATKHFDGRPVIAHLVGGLTKEKDVLLPLLNEALASCPALTVCVTSARPVEGALFLANKLAQKRRAESLE